MSFWKRSPEEVQAEVHKLRDEVSSEFEKFEEEYTHIHKDFRLLLNLYTQYQKLAQAFYDDPNEANFNEADKMLTELKLALGRINQDTHKIEKFLALVGDEVQEEQYFMKKIKQKK